MLRSKRVHQGHARDELPNISLVRKLAQKIVKQHNDTEKHQETTIPSSIVSRLPQRSAAQHYKIDAVAIE